MWLLLLAIFAGVVLFRHYRESLAFPPGPLRLPLFGTWEGATGKIQGSRLILRATEGISEYGKIMGWFAGPSERYKIIGNYQLQ